MAGAPPPDRPPATGAPQPGSARDPVADQFDPRANTFLARRAYRRRRLMDAARLLPAFGVALFLMPTLWVSVETPGDTASGYIYIFGVWLCLIVLGGIIARRIAVPVRGTEAPATDDDLPGPGG